MSAQHRNKQKAWLATLVIQGLLFVAAYYLVAWRAPDPPNPELGIALSFLASSTGGGASQIGDQTEPETTASQTKPSGQTVQKLAEEGLVKAAPTQKAETTQNDTPQPKKPKINEEAVFKPNTTGGKKQGALNPDAQYAGPKGGAGSGSGSSLNMAGWQWERAPKPKEQTNETGKIVYEITVDEDGNIINVKLVSSTVSPQVERIYRRSVDALKLVKTSSDAAASTSKGTITFVLKPS